jgi:hypothetical protein
MALVPAANGVEAVIAAEGIRIVDTGGNRFRIGIDVQQEIATQSAVFVGPWPVGYSEQTITGDISLDYSGLYLFLTTLSAGLNVGPIVAGPDDRFCVSVKNMTDDTIEAGTQAVIKIYNRDPALNEVQAADSLGLFDADPEAVYRVLLQVYNVSGTLDTNGLQIRNLFTPLSSKQEGDPA